MSDAPPNKILERVDIPVDDVIVRLDDHGAVVQLISLAGVVSVVLEPLIVLHVVVERASKQ